MTDETEASSTDSAADSATEPIDPARPAAPGAPDSAQPPTASASDRPDGAGVSVPRWLAGALVVVLALLIGVAGFALGRVTAPDDGHDFRPAVATEMGGRDGQTRGLPMPGGPNGGGPNGGGPGFPGPQGGRQGDDSGNGSRTFPGDRDRDQSGGQSGDQSGSSDAPTPPSLPGN